MESAVYRSLSYNPKRVASLGKRVMSSPVIMRFALFTIFCSVVPVHATGTDSALIEARNIFLQGVDGNKRAVREATRRFRLLNAHNPGNPVYLAYLGASMTLQGRDAANNLDKQRLTEAGLRKVDQALGRLSSDDSKQSAAILDTLLVAADTFVYIPAFFNRYKQGKELLQVILKHPGFGSMVPQYKAAVYFTAALIAHGDGNEDEYRRYLKLSMGTDPEGRDGRSAKALLAQAK